MLGLYVNDVNWFLENSNEAFKAIHDSSLLLI